MIEFSRDGNRLICQLEMKLWSLNPGGRMVFGCVLVWGGQSFLDYLAR
jgi:hypothetical protein